MISPDKLFGNLFDDAEITPQRLADFGEDTLNKLTAGNTENRFNQFISRLTPASEVLRQELGDVNDAAYTLEVKG